MLSMRMKNIVDSFPEKRIILGNILGMCLYYSSKNTILLVGAQNWKVTYKDLLNKIVCDPSNH